MGITSEKRIENLIVDTSAFINNAQLHEIAENIITCKEVVQEITNKRQLRRLAVLPYDLKIVEVFPENIQIITEFSKKTGDYCSLSATDIKVLALTYQLEKEKIGVDHLNLTPTVQKQVNVLTKAQPISVQADVTGFYYPGQKQRKTSEASEEVKSNVTDVAADTEELAKNFEDLNCEELDVIENVDVDDILQRTEEDSAEEQSESSSDDEDDDETGWITPSNVQTAKKQVNSELIEEKHVKVACMSTDFAMQNVLKQMNLNVAALDGRIIKQLRTYILRCYTCFKTTSIMTKQFCPKCGNNTLKRVAYSLDENGQMQIHINARKPLTGRGKKFSLPRIKGGKHPNNPILVEDQPMADQKPSRLARTKNNPLNDEYIAGFSPFVMRDVNSKSAQLCIRPGSEVKNWMKKNPNEAHRKRRK